MKHAYNPWCMVSVERQYHFFKLSRQRIIQRSVMKTLLLISQKLATEKSMSLAQRDWHTLIQTLHWRLDQISVGEHSESHASSLQRLVSEPTLEKLTSLRGMGA